MSDALVRFPRGDQPQHVGFPVGQRLGQARWPGGLVRDVLRRDPEDRWAAVFGRIAGYSFAVAVVTGS